MIDALIAILSTPLNVCLMVALALHWRRKRVWFAIVAQGLMLAATPLALFLYSHHPAMYRAYYGRSESVFSLLVAAMILSLDIKRTIQFAVAILIVLHLDLKIQCQIESQHFMGYYNDVTLSRLWEIIDLAWTALWAFDLYSEFAATPQWRKTWQILGQTQAFTQETIRSSRWGTSSLSARTKTITSSER